MVIGSTGTRRRGRPKTFDRDPMIDVAMECYWREGTDGVSLNELYRRADVSKPGVYREFGGEDGLMAAVLEHYTRHRAGARRSSRPPRTVPSRRSSRRWSSS